MMQKKSSWCYKVIVKVENVKFIYIIDNSMP